MCSIFFVLLLSSLTNANAASDRQDTLVDNLLDRAVHVSYLDDDLDKTTHGKSSSLAVQNGAPRLAVLPHATSPLKAHQMRAPSQAQQQSRPLQSLHKQFVSGMCAAFHEPPKPTTVAKASASADVPANGLGRKYRVAVVGGGPAGASAAEIFAEDPNIETILFERKMNNCKPCGGAIPLCMLSEFDLPDSVVDRKVNEMTMISPTNREIPIGRTLKPNEYIGMTRREVLDKFMRDRAVEKGAQPINAIVMAVDVPKDNTSPYTIHYSLLDGGDGDRKQTMEVDVIIGADGANSRVAQAVDAGEFNYAMAYQERVKIPDEQMKRYENMAEMYVGDDVSPDFYGWVFPKYDHVGVGTGTVVNRPAIKDYQKGVRDRVGDKIKDGKIIKVEAHPIPENYRPRRVVGRVALVGDAAGYVTKCSGEGIYFAAKSGRMAAQSIVKLMKQGTRLPTESEIKNTYIRQYDKAYAPTYTVLDILQKVFYSNNAGREAFVDLCESDYVQKVTFDSYLYKKVQGNNPIEDVKLLGQTLASLFNFKYLNKVPADKPFSNPVESKKRLGTGSTASFAGGKAR